MGDAAVLDDALDRALDPLRERPRLVPTAEVAVGEDRWREPYALLTGHQGGPYVRMDADVGALARVLDGRTSILDAAGLVDVDPEYALEAVHALRQAGVVDGRAVDVHLLLRSKLQPQWRRLAHRAWQALRGQTIRIPGLDAIAGAVYRHGGRWIFTAAFAALSAVVAVAGFAAFVAVGRRGDLGITTEVGGTDAAAIFALLFGALMVHEFGHALALKRAGRKVNGGGFQLYLGHPAFFIDSTDLLFAPRRERALNAALGPYIEAVLAGLLAMYVWAWPSAAGVDVATRVAIVTYVNVAVNLIPFVELDGYWLLTDLLDIPRLRARSFALLRHELPDRLRGRRARFDARERGMAVFGALGLVFTAVALATAWFFWWPLLEAFARGLWRGGWPGRIVLVLLALVVAGPLAEAAARSARSLVRAARRGVDDIVFRLQRSWRVEAAEAIARLHDDRVDDDTLSDLAGRVRRRTVEAREEVVAVGDGGHDWFVVRRGRFEVVSTDGAVLALLVPGEAFGERALLNRGPRQASVRALERSELFVLDGGAYLRALAPEVDEREGAGS